MTDQSGVDWYAVRCIFRFVDREASAATMYEERITLWRADSFDPAVERAEREAGEYASTIAGSPDAYVGLAQAYRFADVPADGAEVFSLVRDSNRKPGAYLDRFFDTGNERQRI
ncbi:DUF4288 domain-containing protein [Kribbella sp. GL6]|uniref:DUF4288 domain-containing protein n=1 Tax=Kribbella sp. GL6 TaxID=3419765 RepID=UPI003CFF638B